jgi:hypothetical protein
LAPPHFLLAAGLHVEHGPLQHPLEPSVGCTSRSSPALRRGVVSSMCSFQLLGAARHVAAAGAQDFAHRGTSRIE